MPKKETKEKDTTKEVKKEKKENKNKHEIEIKVEGKDWDNALERAFQKKAKEVKVDGFRPGKVPRNIYEKKFGKESLYLDGADLVLQDAYTKALEDSKLVPVVQPAVNLKEINDQGVTFVFTIISKPEVKIKKYKGFKVKKDEVKVTKEEINHEIEHLLSHYTELVVKDGKVEEGNVAIIDFEGFKDGVPFEGGKGENYSLEIGSHTFIPGFEEQLVGMKAEEEKEIKVTFPEDYPKEDLKGQEVTFKVKVHEVKEKEKRELDKDFFEDLGMEGIDSKESLEKEIEENIKASKDSEAENKYEDALLETISKEVDVDIPEEMVDEEVHRLIGRFEEQMKMQGISLNDYYRYTNTTHEDLHHHMETSAYKNVLYRLMLEEIMNLEKIEVSEEEANKEAENLAQKYQMSKEDFLQQVGGLDMIQYDLEMRKVVDLLKEANK